MDFNRNSGASLHMQVDRSDDAGKWMPWTGIGLAAALWLGVGLWLYAGVGVANLGAADPLALIGGFLLLLTPGVAMICVGFMARESRRSAEANAVVLASARMLLTPADTAREEISALAQAIVHETQTLNHALAETRTRVDGLKSDIDSSVAGALKAAEIVRSDSETLLSRMKAERESLLGLAASLQQQAEGLSRAIPRHAQMMSEAARSAHDEISKADEALDIRVRALEETARTLSERIMQVDALGADSHNRAQGLASALTKLEEQLLQSTRMVDAAKQTGELATAASRNTAAALRDAVSDALAAALKATETINSTSSHASEEARAALERLKEAGLQAESTTRAAGLAARTQAEETEQRISQMADLIIRAATRATTAAESGLENARSRIERASLLLGQMREETEIPTIDSSLRAPATPPSPRSKPTASAAIGTVQRDAPAEQAQTTPAKADDAGGAAASEKSSVIEPGLWRGGHRAAAGLSWRDLINNGDDGAGGGSATEDPASAVIDRLGRAGVRLSVVNAADLQRIARAAHEGDGQRRRAIRDVAPIEIQRVARLLDADTDLQAVARTFIAREEPEALKALSSAEQARNNPEPRLSAYLFLDAALGS